MRSPLELIPNLRNPRDHSPRQIKQLKRSIGKFGFVSAIVTDSAGHVIIGNARTLAAIQLGLTTIPTINVDHLNEPEKRALALTDNRLAETSKWNDKILGEELQALSSLNLDFGLDITGFEMGEIDFRIENATSLSKDDYEIEVELDPISGPPVSKPGDLWILGDHRLVNGSALDEGAFDTLMNGDKAAMVFTDPPYNVPVSGHVSGNGDTKHREFAMASGEMTKIEFVRFLLLVFELLIRHTVSGSIHFCCMDWRHCEDILAAAKAVYSELKNICIWVKSNAGMGSFYRSQHELIFVFKSGSQPHQNNIQLGRHGRHRSNIWNYPNANAFGKTSEEGPLFKLHPTVKPVKLIADAIMDCSSRGEIILDGFVGSGTTIIAAERTGRRCFGIEIDPLYVDIAIRRWQAYTGESALHGVSGIAFDSLSAEANHGEV